MPKADSKKQTSQVFIFPISIGMEYLNKPVEKAIDTILKDPTVGHLIPLIFKHFLPGGNLQRYSLTNGQDQQLTLDEKKAKGNEFLKKHKELGTISWKDMGSYLEKGLKDTKKHHGLDEDATLEALGKEHLQHYARNHDNGITTSTKNTTQQPNERRSPSPGRN